MFSEDIRLNKTFNGSEKFRFNTRLFTNNNPKTVRKWEDFYTLSRDYKLLFSGVHMMPKTRRNLMDPMPVGVKDKMVITDIGGLDILTNEALQYANKFMVKGDIWKTWMNKMGYPNVFVTGCPQYDYYLHSDLIGIDDAKVLSKNDFLKKYNIDGDKKILLIAPSNPACHTDQFNKNMSEFENISRLAEKNNFQVIIKTYPHDYVFHERESKYNGVYKRIYNNSKPQFEIVKSHISNSIVIESQDHFSALLYSDILFNMSGSHVAWETYFTKTQSFSMNYKKQIYFGSVRYLPDYVKLPDGIINIEIENSADLFSDSRSDKRGMDEYISREFSLPNILKHAESLLEI